VRIQFSILAVVLVSTSVGQEGLDFHHYCHAITHWNLPSNPSIWNNGKGGYIATRATRCAECSAALRQKALRHGESDVWETVFSLGAQLGGAGK